jgi:hypothetical protein
MFGCETEVFVAQAFPEKAAREVVEKGAISELSMHGIGQTLLEPPRQRMIRLAPAGCKEIARRPAQNRASGKRWLSGTCVLWTACDMTSVGLEQVSQ